MGKYLARYSIYLAHLHREKLVSHLARQCDKNKRMKRESDQLVSYLARQCDKNTSATRTPVRPARFLSCTPVRQEQAHEARERTSDAYRVPLLAIGAPAATRDRPPRAAATRPAAPSLDNIAIASSQVFPH